MVVQEIAKKWGSPTLSASFVQKNRAIEATRISRICIITEDAKKLTIDSITRAR